MTRLALVVVAALTALAALLGGMQTAEAATEGHAWEHSAGHWPVVYVEDHTDHHWSLAAAVSAWGSGLQLGSCRTGAGCIDVTSPARGSAAPLGQSLIHVSGARITTVTIRLNASDEAQPAAVRKVAAEHELGHSLGLGHDTSHHSVMGPTAYGYDNINSYVRRELAAVYGV